MAVIDDKCEDDTEREGGMNELDDDGERGSGCDNSNLARFAGGGDARSPVEEYSSLDYEHEEKCALIGML